MDFIVSMTKDEVRAARKRLNKTQREMSLELGVTEGTYRRWERIGVSGPAAKAIGQMVPA